MYTECFLSLQHILQNACCFYAGLILLFISHAYRKLNIIEHNTLLGMISDLRLPKATFFLIVERFFKVLLGMISQ